MYCHDHQNLKKKLDFEPEEKKETIDTNTNHEANSSNLLQLKKVTQGSETIKT